MVKERVPVNLLELISKYPERRVQLLRIKEGTKEQHILSGLSNANDFTQNMFSLTY
jgi:hypothetical protein